MRQVAFFLALLTLVLPGLSGCSVDTSALPVELCGLGATEPCTCEDGKTGARVCGKNGNYGECTCAVIGESGGSGGSSAGSGGSSGGGASGAGEGGAGDGGGTGASPSVDGSAGEPVAGADGGGKDGEALDGGTAAAGGTGGVGGSSGTGGAGGSAGTGGAGGTASRCDELGDCCARLFLPAQLAACTLVINAGVEANCEQLRVSFCP